MSLTTAFEGIDCTDEYEEIDLDLEAPRLPRALPPMPVHYWVRDRVDSLIGTASSWRSARAIATAHGSACDIYLDDESVVQSFDY